MKRRIQIKTLKDLFSKSNRTTKLVNLITLYRVIAAPFLLIFLFTGQTVLFKWLLLLSFSTDAADGYLARKFKVNSVLGAKLDSVGDGLTILVTVIGLIKLRLDFIEQQWPIVTILLSLFIVQVIFAFVRYKKLSSFHTYAAKISAVLLGIFMLSLFFFEQPVYVLFYVASIATAYELIEEIILVAILPRWLINVKGLYWVLKNRRKNKKG